MDPELRWRLDAVIALLLFIAITTIAIAVAVGGPLLLLFVLVLGLFLGMLLQALGFTPVPEQHSW